MNHVSWSTCLLGLGLGLVLGLGLGQFECRTKGVVIMALEVGYIYASCPRVDERAQGFNKIGAMLANYNIAVMPFNHVELKYGAVGFCLPGVGKIKYLETGRHLAMFLETRLPMGPDHPDNELAQALSLTAAKAHPNGYEMLQTLFEHIIPAFNMDELTMKWTLTLTLTSKTP